MNKKIHRSATINYKNKNHLLIQVPEITLSHTRYVSRNKAEDFNSSKSSLSRNNDLLNKLSRTSYNNGFLKNIDNSSLLKTELYTKLKDTKNEFLINDKITYSDYENIIDSKMKFYRSSSSLSPTSFADYYMNEKKIKMFQSDQNFISLKEKNQIENMFIKNKKFLGNYTNFNRIINKTQKEKIEKGGQGCDIILRINAKNDNKNLFNNPYESLGVLKTNNLIYDEVSKNSIQRQKILYDKSIDAYNSYKMKFKTKMPKIIITDLDNLKQIRKKAQLKEEEEKGKKAIEQEEEIELKQKDEQKNHLILRNKKKLFQEPKAKMFSYYKYPNKNTPECKELFTFTHKNKNNLILIGGMSTYTKSALMWNLNLEKLEWSQVLFNNQPSELNRYGHTSVLYSNKIFVYGGRTKDYIRDPEGGVVFLNGLEYYNLEERLWYTPSIPTSYSPSMRRDHIAFQLSNNMIIHGGVGEFNEILNDVYMLSLVPPYKWTKLSISNNFPSPKLFGHAGALCLPNSLSNNSKFNIYKLPEGFYDNKNEFGIPKRALGYYIFGGKYKIEDNKCITNNLYLVSIGKKPIEFKLINNYKGKPPSPRYYHSMSYYENANFLIVHGGRNDKFADNIALNDTFIFNIINYEWVNIILYSYNSDFKILNRCGHKTEIIGNKLIVFGGMNSNNYIGSSLFIINLDYDHGIYKGPDENLINRLRSQYNGKTLFFLDNNNNFCEFSICNDNTDDKNDIIIDEDFRAKIMKNQIGIIFPSFSLPNIK